MVSFLMAGFGESKHEPALRGTHVSKSLEFADSTARSGGYAAPLEDLSSREKPWGPRPQLSTKVERHHQGASQLPRQPKARRLLSASTPPSEPQTWDSDSRKAAIPCRLQASADTQNLQSQTPLREAARSPGKDQSQRHRPLQPTAAYSRPSAARAPSRRPRPARTASIRTSGPDTAREAPRPPGASEDGDRGDPPAHGFPALTMATPWTRKQQKILRPSRPPSGDAASRAPPSLAPPSPGSGFSIGLLQVSRGFGGARQTVVCSERGGARPALRRLGLRTAGSEAVLGGIAAEGAAKERWTRSLRWDQRTLVCTCAEERRSHFLVATNPDAPGAGLSALSVCISARISSSDGVGAGEAPRTAPRSCGAGCPEVSAAVRAGIRPCPAALDSPPPRATLEALAVRE